MKDNIPVTRLDFPNPPSIALPWYPLSCGRAVLSRGRLYSAHGIPAVELIWATQGHFYIEYYDPFYRLELKAGQSAFRMFNEKRTTRNLGNVPACYQWMCFDGEDAEKFIMSYGIPLRTALNSGECPEYLYNEAESLFLVNTPYAMRKLISIITNIIALMVPHTSSPKGDRILNHAITLISSQYQHEHFNINALADELKIHRTTLDRIFQAYLRKRPHEYLTSYRLSQSCFLLTAKNLSIKDIAQAVGFSRSNYFCRIFARRYGLTPANWRKQQLGFMDEGRGT